jgi:hypothetical protein
MTLRPLAKSKAASTNTRRRRFLQAAFSWAQWQRLPEEARLMGSIVRLLVVVAVSGLLLDSIKPIWWPQWRAYREFGDSIYIWYGVFNTVWAVIAWLTVVIIADWYAIYFVLALTLIMPGLLACFLEPGLMPIAWHGALGFVAATTIAFKRFFNDLQQRWETTPSAKAQETERFKAALEIRKELVKEMQWAFTTYLQIWLAFTAIFGVSMTILFRDGRINDADLKATAVQMTIGFGACLTIAYCFGLANALRIMQKVRHQWTVVLLPQKR